jgi:adenine deaminase
MGSLHGATRYGLDGEIGGLGGGRRADLVLIDDELKPQSTWYGGELVVKDRAITPILEEALSRRYRYPKAAYATVKVPDGLKLVPEMPAMPGTLHAIRTTLPGIVLFHDRIDVEPEKDWATLFAKHDLCFVTVVERHGKSQGNVAHGFLRSFGLNRGAVGSSVGHDSHNIIIAGTNEADMSVALDAIREVQGGVCVVADGKVLAMVPLPIAGLLSDKRVGVVAEETQRLKAEWEKAGCTIPYMGFNLIPLSVIPEIRITDKGLVLVPEMVIVPTFEPATNA